MGRARWQVIRQYLPFPIFSPAHSSAYHSLSYYIFESLFVLSTLFYPVYPFPFFCLFFFFFFFLFRLFWRMTVPFWNTWDPSLFNGHWCGCGPVPWTYLPIYSFLPYSIDENISWYPIDFFAVCYCRECPAITAISDIFWKKSETIDHFVYSETEKKKNETKEEEEDETKDVVMNRENKTRARLHEGGSSLWIEASRMLCVLVLLPACAHYTPLHHHHSLSYTPQTSSSSLFHVLLPDSRRDRAREDHLSLSWMCDPHGNKPNSNNKRRKKNEED